jgi:alpha-beta hydrolase superfamily lysophospholipase
MPFLETDGIRAYYRHWAAEDPTAAVIFLHGFGEHTGVYHRYGFALNSRGIDVWAVDQRGHGLTPGNRGDFGSTAASAALGERLTEIAEATSPGLPLVAAGHSFGAVVTLSRALDAPDRYRAAVVSGSPLTPVPQLAEADSALDLELGWLSADEFYLDAMENDPLAFADADGVALARELTHAWSRFGNDLPDLAVPTLAVHGTDDPVADIGGVRAYADQIDALTLIEIAGGRHDILNDVEHRRVAELIADFVVDQTTGE